MLAADANLESRTNSATLDGDGVGRPTGPSLLECLQQIIAKNEVFAVTRQEAS
jgi:hypothetical protein